MSNSTLGPHRLRLGWIVALLLLPLLAGCGGTKVYDTTKTVVYNGSIYNVTNTKSVSQKVTGKLSDDSVVDLRNADKKRFEGLVKEHGDIYVRMAYEFDGEEMLYRAGRVDSWRDFNRMESDFDRAGDKIAKLMKEKKTAQLKL